MKLKNGLLGLTVMTVMCALLSVSAAHAAEWRQKKEYKDNFGGSVEVTATYYAAEYVEKATQDEAAKNMWTSDEMEDYRYNLLQQLKLNDTIPVFLKIKNRGPAMHMAPFERQVRLVIGKHRLSPVDFDRRFNFKITDDREGFVYFPRYDEKGKPYLTPKVKTLRFSIDGGVSPVTLGKTLDFLWDVKDDNPDRLLKGKSGARLEMDRLTKRIGILSKEGKQLQDRLDEVQAELQKVNNRMMELQKQL